MALSIAVVGLRFGHDFVPLYQAHPDVGRVVVVDTDAGQLDLVGGRFGVAERASSIDAVLADPTIDAVHLVTPVPTHAELTLRALDAGKHVACAVPMALTLDELDAIVARVERSGLTYMMMETSLFGREWFLARELRDAGELGDISLYHGFHIQNLDGYARYWQGYPPMKYLTHALSPGLELLDTRATKVSCYGAGRLTPDRFVGGYDQPFPVETALFRLEGTPAVAQVTMGFFQCARPYIEGFSVYGSRGGIEWSPRHDGPLTVHHMSPALPGHGGNQMISEQVEPPGRPDLLPEPLHPYLTDLTVPHPTGGEPFVVPGSHGGSHPHLAHEFVRSIIEARPPLVDARKAARITAAGICAHDSAMREREVEIPAW